MCDAKSRWTSVRVARWLQARYSFEVVLGPAHEVDEDVLERRLRCLPCKIRPIPVGRDRGIERRLLAPAHVQAAAERRDRIDARASAQLLGNLGQLLDIARRDRVGDEMRG